MQFMGNYLLRNREKLSKSTLFKMFGPPPHPTPNYLFNYQVPQLGKVK